MSIVNNIAYYCHYIDNILTTNYNYFVMNRLRTSKRVQIVSALVGPVAHMKGVAKHGHAVPLHFMHYNFVRVHKTLRVTPAMEAGIADHVRSAERIDEIVTRTSPGAALAWQAAREIAEATQRLGQHDDITVLTAASAPSSAPEPCGMAVATSDRLACGNPCVRPLEKRGLIAWIPKLSGESIPVQK